MDFILTEFIVIILSFYIIIDLYKLYKRKKYILTTKYVVDVQRRSSFSLGWLDIFIVIPICSTFNTVRQSNDYAYLWLLLPIIFAEIRERRKNGSDITLYDNGMVFDNTYVLWQDVRSIKTTGKRSLTIESYESSTDKVTIENLDSVEDLEASIRYMLV